MKSNSANQSNKNHSNKTSPKDILKSQKKLFITTILFIIMAISLMIYKFITKNFEDGFVCLLALILFVIPTIVDWKTRIRLPGFLQISVILFVFCSQILGEIFNLYVTFPLWDVLLHTFSGFLAAAIGFTLLNLLSQNDSNKNEFTLGALVVMAFCFSMTIAVFWEFIEFGCDKAFHFDMQKDNIVYEINSVLLDPTNTNQAISIDSITNVTVNGKELGLNGYLDIGLVDTMKDLFCNTLGAIIFITFGIIYLKKGGNWGWIRQFTPKSKH